MIIQVIFEENNCNTYITYQVFLCQRNYEQNGKKKKYFEFYREDYSKIVVITTCLFF